MGRIRSIENNNRWDAFRSAADIIRRELGPAGATWAMNGIRITVEDDGGYFEFYTADGAGNPGLFGYRVDEDGNPVADLIMPGVPVDLTDAADVAAAILATIDRA